MESLFIPNMLNHGNFQKSVARSKSQDICQELIVSTGHTQASSSGRLRILQNTMIAGWYTLHSSTDAKWSPQVKIK